MLRSGGPIVVDLAEPTGSPSWASRQRNDPGPASLARSAGTGQARGRSRCRHRGGPKHDGEQRACTYRRQPARQVSNRGYLRSAASSRPWLPPDPGHASVSPPNVPVFRARRDRRTAGIYFRPRLAGGSAETRSGSCAQCGRPETSGAMGPASSRRVARGRYGGPKVPSNLPCFHPHLPPSMRQSGHWSGRRADGSRRGGAVQSTADCGGGNLYYGGLGDVPVGVRTGV